MVGISKTGKHRGGFKLGRRFVVMVSFVVSASVVPLAAAQENEASVCANPAVGATAGLSQGVNVVSLSGSELVDHDPEFAAAVSFLRESTEFLSQSDDADPVLVDGRLRVSCEVGFDLEGTPARVGAAGVTGLKVSENARWLVQALEGDRGNRMMVVVKNSAAPLSYSVDLSLDPDVSVIALGNGSAIFVDRNDHMLGSIAPPWALDANGDAVPVTQVVTDERITVTIQPDADTAWPVIADPEYHVFTCRWFKVGTSGSASSYLNGRLCPNSSDVRARGYAPVWIEHFNHWRVGRPDGNCGYMPDRVNVWVVGVIYDFRQACKGHDYCYDLGHSDRLNYPNVHKRDCDSIMFQDMKFDCSHRNRTNTNFTDCMNTARTAKAAVHRYGSFR